MGTRLQNLTRCLTSKLLLLPIALSVVAIMVTPASAQTCLQDEFTAAGNHQKLQCTANDVSIAFASNPRGLDGSPKPTCQQGSHFSFVADFHVTTTATARENIGLYFQTNGGANALTGTCGDNIIAPPHHSSNVNDVVCLGSGATASCTGSGTYEELDAKPDTCGDISTADNNQVITVEVDNALCQAAPGTNQVALPNCTSWQQPGGTILCQTPAPNYPWVAAAVPGSPSKCNCDSTFTVPIIVQSPSVSVTKTCTTTKTPGTTNTTCDAGTEGSTVTYNLSVSNSSNVGNLTLDQLCDTAYGNVATAAGYPTACAAGTVGTVSTTDCSMPQTIAMNGVYSCKFTAVQGESTTVKNTAVANGLGSDGKTAFTGSSSQVTVTSTDASSSAVITKSLGSLQQACATARYNVNVHNSGGADENLTLNSLTDSAFGSIIPNSSASIVATTCTVPQTLTVGGTDYSCTFDAQFCDTPKTIITTTGVCANNVCTAGTVGSACSQNSDCNVTCTGIQHTNTVNGAFTGDDGPAETVTITPGALTVNVCVKTQ